MFKLKSVFIVGASLFGAGRATPLLMIQHKEAVAAVLIAFADQG
jgi:hypothetical protein